MIHYLSYRPLGVLQSLCLSDNALGADAVRALADALAPQGGQRSPVGAECALASLVEGRVPAPRIQTAEPGTNTSEFLFGMSLWHQIARFRTRFYSWKTRKIPN